MKGKALLRRGLLADILRNDLERGHYEIALGVDNHAAVDAAFRAAVSKGAVPVMEPATMEWGQRTSYIADPEGNLIEIGSFIP